MASCEIDKIALVVESISTTLSQTLHAASVTLPRVTETQRDSLIPSHRIRLGTSEAAPLPQPHSRLVCGVPLRCLSSAAAVAPVPNKLLLTPSTVSNVRSVALALSSWSWSEKCSSPVLVEGVPGCGKSCTLNFIASACGFGDDLVNLQLDDSIDSKALIGSYVCAERPGEFRWQAGVITDAVLTGRWVVIEDIDRAPAEVLAALIPLMQSRTLQLPNRPEPLVAHPNFLLLATRTTSNSLNAVGIDELSSAASTVDGPLASVVHLWTRVSLQPLDSTNRPLMQGSSLSTAAAVDAHSELRQISQGLFPWLPQVVVDTLLQVCVPQSAV
jgi:hypothetical protein